MPATATARRKAAKLPLALYNQKRRFNVTREPRGGRVMASKGSLRFVVQQHHASVMHYDFRLQINGVLVSWAVPKGPSLAVADKRLAVQTENHPLSYAAFEGEIPQGEYGGGRVIVWDEGAWLPDGDATAGLKKGHLSFVLKGQKLQGRFGLIRTRGKVAEGPRSTWLLMKKADDFADKAGQKGIVLREPASVLSSLRVDEIGTPAARAASAPKGARAATLPEQVDLQLATLVERPPDTGDWLYEVKFDGYRVLVRLEGGEVSLHSRNGLNWSGQFPAINAALARLHSANALLDGELCYVTPEGQSSFQQLQRALPRGGGKPEPDDQARLAIYFFDLLFLNGKDLRDQPLAARKQQLKKLLSATAAKIGKWPLLYSDHLEARGRMAFTQACTAGLEGLIGKRRDSPYTGGRSKDWIKLKCQKRQEFVIVGYTAARGSRTGFGALLLATREGQEWKYRGKVGTGFDNAALRELTSLLKARQTTQGVLAKPPRLSGIQWVKPDLLCEVRYAEITAEGALRHGSFQGLRIDKPATEVALDQPAPSPRKRRSGAAKTADEATVAGVRISHPERVIDERSGLSKGVLAQYYAEVGGLLLPYAGNRPLALLRCPDGSAQQCFFQKHKTAGFGAAVHQRRLSGQDILFIDDTEGLLQLVQFNVIELHGWGSTLNHPAKPGWIVIDLDPDTALPFSAVVDAALEVRDTFASLDLKCWVKTTGGKGLHVVIPIEPRAGWSAVKDFSHAIADALASRAPQRYVSNMSKAKRPGRIFIDYLRNAEGATAVLPYSVRARPGATVALPVPWQDLKHLDPQEFTVGSASRWLVKRRKDPWAELLTTSQSLPDVSTPARTQPARRST